MIGYLILLANAAILIAAIGWRHVSWSREWQYALGNGIDSVSGNRAYLARAYAVVGAVRSVVGGDGPGIVVLLRVLPGPRSYGPLTMFGRTRWVRKFWWSKREILVEVYEPMAFDAVFLHEVAQHVLAHQVLGHMNIFHDTQKLHEIEAAALDALTNHSESSAPV